MKKTPRRLRKLFKLNTDEQMRRAVRREMPPGTRTFKDKTKYDRKNKTLEE